MLSLFQFDLSVFGLLVALTLLGPLVLALLVLRFPFNPGLRALAPLTALPALALALGPRLEVFQPQLVLGIRLGVDAASGVFLLFSGLLWLCASWFGLAYLAHDPRRARYTAFFLFAQAGNLGLILAQDIATFYFCFALMSFASYGLVVHDGRPASQAAGRLYLALAIAGEVLQFIAFSIIALQVPDARLAEVPAAVAASPHREALILLLLASLGIKAGLVPLHVWLPLAHPVAPTPASAVLSGAMIKAGLLGWIRFLPLGQAEWPAAGEVVVVLGLLGSLGGALVGVTQRHPKAVLAYSSISQMGLMIVLVGLGVGEARLAPYVMTAAVLYALHHGLAKGVLFLGVGMATSAPGGRWGQRVVLAGCALAGLALAGAPWTSGMLAKTLLKKVAGMAPGDGAGSLGWLLSLAAVGTTLLMARFLVRVRALAHEQEHRHEASSALWWPWLLLLAASLLVGWLAVPDLTASVLQAGFKASLLWKLIWPVLLGAALAVGVAWARRDAAPEVKRVPDDPVLTIYRLLLSPLGRAASAVVSAFHHLAVTADRDGRDLAQALQRRSRLLTRAESRLSGFVLLGLTLLVVAGLTAWLGG